MAKLGNSMKTDDFDYELPAALIAQMPSKFRGGSRLLVVEDKRLLDHQFVDLPQFLRAGDLLVMNDTKVIPARLHLNKPSGGAVEVMLERLINEDRFIALAKSNKPLKPGQVLLQSGEAVVQFERRVGTFFEFRLLEPANGIALFYDHGHIPLPPYIRRVDKDLDVDRYQTIFAEKEGAVAAPTAGLHFNQQMLAELPKRGVNTATLTLHVGAGTFQPVKVDDVQSHQMHRERFEVSAAVVETIQQTKAAGGRVIAVGTTSVRALETAAVSGELCAGGGDSQLFIYPGFQFQVVDALITNFHLPKSTLLMLVSAFAGKQSMLQAYHHAVESGYRFFSYGDAMFIEKTKG